MRFPKAASRSIIRQLKAGAGRKYVAPVPKSRKIKADGKKQASLDLEQTRDGSSRYNPRQIVNEIRGLIATWRALPNPND